ncbi:unnamed protein product, partial [Rotaria sordida]
MQSKILDNAGTDL